MEEEILQRYIAGEATDKEKKLVVEWLDADTENMRQYMSMRKLFDISIWRSESEPAAYPSSSLRSRKKIFVEILKIAAAAVLAFFIARQIYLPERENGAAVMQSLYAPVGQHAKLTLSDGTKVWLNAGSTLSFPSRFDKGSRNVRLKGEGFFEVTKDAEKPFVVSTERYDIKALGTSFNVLAYPDASGLFETSLLEGSVEVSDNATKRMAKLSPEQCVTVDENGEFLISSIKDMDYFLWRDGIMSFDDEPIMNIIGKLELYFDVKIAVRNKSILENKYKYTGKFRVRDGLEHALKVLQVNKPFKYQKNDDKNIITIN